MLATTCITIRELRRHLGLSQLELAAVLHVTRPMVQRWERGANGPSPAKIAAMAQMAVMAGLLDAVIVAGPNATTVTCGCGLVHEAGTRCPACLTDYTPSPQEIEAACETMRDGKECKVSGWEVPTVRKRGGRRMRDREGSHGDD